MATEISEAQPEVVRVVSDFASRATASLLTPETAIRDLEPFTVRGQKVEGKDVTVAILPHNLESFADCHQVVAFVKMALLAKATLIISSIDVEPQTFQRLGVTSFWIGVLGALDTQELPRFPKGSSSFTKGTCWIVDGRVDWKRLTPAWRKCYTGGLSVKMLKAPCKTLPKIYNSMQSLLPLIPKYTKVPGLSQWIKTNPAYDVKRINLFKRGLLSDYEKAIWANREIALNGRINAWCETIHPEKIASNLCVDEKAYLQVVQERTTFLAPIERLSAQRANLLYGGPSKRKTKNSKKKSAVQTLVEGLSLNDKVMVFGPWVALGIPAIPLQDKHYSDRGFFLPEVYIEDLRKACEEHGLTTLYAQQLLAWGASLI